MPVEESSDLKQKSCRLCQQGPVSVCYRGPIRAGSFGKATSQDFCVLRCHHCGVAYLDPYPSVEYDSGGYRVAYNDSALVEDYYAIHDKDQVQYLAALKGVSFRGKVIADFGCGGGAFLDHVRGLARETVAVEPFAGYHKSLRERGHRVYAYVEELLNDPHRPVIDIAVSFHVLEHVANPVQHLEKIGESLGPEGHLFVVTPNLDDFLMQIDLEPYQRFFYRTAHPWYFDACSLRWAAQAARFSAVQIFFQHNYDLSNALCWLGEHRPTGVGKLSILDDRINAAWQAFLEDSGMSDVIWAKLAKRPS